uniref:Myosin light chain kinase, smooth muscle-like n=1 Tax=Sinocyclocheilus rhinocerous TaxID=307959 RepID=A0A673GJ81_9TELE
MSIADGKTRYVSTFRIQLSSSQSKGDNGQVSQPAHIPTITTDVKKPGETSNAGNHTSGLDPPLFTEPLEDCIVDEGNDITLKGTITGSQPISVSWLHNGEPVLFGKSSLVGGVVTLVVRECLPEDAGAYTCVAENTAGKTSSSSAVCVRDYETIIGIRNNIANTSHSHPNSSHPHTPDMLSGVLNSSQNVPDDISVFKGPQSPQSPQTGSPITSSPALKREVSFVILSTCVFVFTAPPLQFVDPLDRLEVHVGETARLKCVFKGSSPVASCWVYNKKEVVESSRFHIESCNESSSLVFSEALPEDSGRYTIFVRDRKSSAQHTVTLNVIDLPQPPASCPVAYVLSPHSLVLSWSGPSYDGGSAVTGYVVEVCESPGATDQWRELTAQCKSTSLRVTSGLQPQGEYCFRVRACNAVGVSEPSQESQPIRMDNPGEKPVEYVAVTINTEDKLTGHYNVHEKLGVGKFGQVFRMTHKETGRVCAGKFYKGRRTKEREAARKEIELMNFLHHPKLVQCLAAYDNKAEMVMVMEYVAGGELFERIVDDSFEHTEVSSVGYMRQILEGIQYMHQQNIVHLDLKPENIVCVDRTGIQVKIIDFGLASKLDPNTPVKVMHGTPEFVAPEVINYEPICLATDMWSIGVICYILLSGESPFQGESDSETLTLVTAAQWEFDEESFEDITDLAKDFISSLLSKDVRRRMLCEEAMAHSWLVYTCVDSSSSSTKNLSKDKMKRFLTRQKWKKTGKALLALKRMAILSKPEASASLSPVDETEKALQSLDLKLQSKPEFSKTLSDLTVPQGSSAQLSCLITGYPDPEVVWLKAGELLELQEECVQVDYEEDGSCTLTLENVSPHHSGLYSCKATNVLGEALCSATLTVQQKD